MTDSGGNSNMGDLVPVYQRDLFGKGAIQCVNARELHGWLKARTKFADWIRKRIKECGFIQGVDFVSFSENSEEPNGGRPSEEYWTTISMAKELSMLEKNEQGREARRYFISKEEAYHALVADQSNRSLAHYTGIELAKMAFDRLENQMNALVDGHAEMKQERDEMAEENAKLAEALHQTTEAFDKAIANMKWAADKAYAAHGNSKKLLNEAKRRSEKDLFSNVSRLPVRKPE